MYLLFLLGINPYQDVPFRNSVLLRTPTCRYAAFVAVFHGVLAQNTYSKEDVIHLSFRSSHLQVFHHVNQIACIWTPKS